MSLQMIPRCVFPSDSTGVRCACISPRTIPRRAVIVAASCVLLLLARNPASAAGDDRFLDFDTYATSALRDWKTPAMAVAVVKDGRIILARGYGVRKLGGNEAVDADTVFPIASITKAFNATALAILVDEGKLRWTDPIRSYLPEFELRDPYMTREVSIADLLSHRTGLADP